MDVGVRESESESASERKSDQHGGLKQKQEQF